MNLAQASAIGPFLAQLRQRIDAKMTEAGRDVWGWRALSEAVGVLERNSDVLDDITLEGLHNLLRLASSGDSVSLTEKVRTIYGMSASQIIEDMEKGADALKAAYERAKERKERVLAILEALGEVGARLLLSFMFI